MFTLLNYDNYLNEYIVLISRMNQTNLLILGIGVSVHKTDGVLRFEHYCKAYGLEYRILGDGKIWQGGDMSVGTGGGQKINEVLEAIENMDNKLIILCDTFDLFPLAGKNEILEKFNKLCKPDEILFSSEIYCWPDEKLKISYPTVNTKYKYLNSGCIMGYRNNIYQLIKNDNVQNNDDDQLFFTLKFLSGEKIVLDYNCELFQTLSDTKDDMVIHKNRLYNKYTNSYPILIHGNGASKLFLNHIENYIEPYPLMSYSYTLVKNLKLLFEPKVFFALFINSSKDIEINLLFKNIQNINYQNREIYIYDKQNDLQIMQLANIFGFIYKGNMTTYYFDDFKNSNCEYYFLLEQKCIITKKNILYELLPYCKGYHRIISPLLHSKNNNLFTNYWGALDNNGYYKRASDYIEIIENQKRGLWNAPYVSGAIIIHRDIIINWDLLKPNKFTDNDMQLCCNLRKYTLFMYMANFNDYGYLADD